ncbi:hypothetical protein [Chryseobacterium koreense]|uniref:hypothetical protein n=1 Tax=Chryseobacterium koreense TaxID=232216 RepID=UPI00128C646B|nr:hypothetical protein [Chryseobacterium koreense]MBB5332586.1 hypothetical protein [Chryseobacterium koreense]
MSTMVYYEAFLILFVAFIIFSSVEIIKSPYSSSGKLLGLFMVLLMPFFGSVLFHWYRKG